MPVVIPEYKKSNDGYWWQCVCVPANGSIPELFEPEIYGERASVVCRYCGRTVDWAQATKDNLWIDKQKENKMKKINDAQGFVLVGAAILFALSWIIPPVIAVRKVFDDPATVSLEWVPIGEVFGYHSLLDPTYTINVAFLAAEWLMIAILAAFGLWIAGRVGSKL